MPSPWYPAAERNPGVNAGYRAGRTTMRSVVCHYTVGRNSTGIGKQGYFQFLVARDGHIQQFAEADALCWHGGLPWNGFGPGIEVEYLDEPTIFTPEAEAATGLLVQWLHDEWGVPLDFYDGPRVGDWNGFITHRSLIQSGDAHSDYWPHLPTGDTDVALELTDFAWMQNNISGQTLTGANVTNAMTVGAVHEAKNEILAALGTGGAPVSLLPSDLDAIAEKVADLLAARLKD